jgi:hypothetical protein
MALFLWWSLWSAAIHCRFSHRPIGVRSLVLVPLALAGVFPRLFLTFTIIEALLAIGPWLLLARE